MTINSETMIGDILFYIKNDFLDNITDPISSTRNSQSSFVMTSYPQKLVNYPLITLKVLNFDATRAGMQTVAMDVKITLEIRVWAKNEKDKDTISNKCYKRLRDIQFTATTGSIANSIHNFTLLSATELDEDGEEQPKSRILNVEYSFYDI